MGRQCHCNGLVGGWVFVFCGMRISQEASGRKGGVSRNAGFAAREYGEVWALSDTRVGESGRPERSRWMSCRALPKTTLVGLPVAAVLECTHRVARAMVTGNRADMARRAFLLPAVVRTTCGRVQWWVGIAPILRKWSSKHDRRDCKDVFDASIALDGYRTLDPRDEQFDAYYVERPTVNQKIVREALTAKKNARPFHWFFTGHTGAGKSTELNRLIADQTLRQHYVPLSISISDEFDIHNIDRTDVIFAMAKACATAADELQGKSQRNSKIASSLGVRKSLRKRPFTPTRRDRWPEGLVASSCRSEKRSSRAARSEK